MANKEIPPQVVDTIRALEQLLHQEQLLSEPLAIGGLAIEDRDVREEVFSGGPGGPWPQHPYHLFQVRWRDWEGEVFIGPFLTETTAHVLVGVWGDYGAALELNCARYVEISRGDVLDIWHNGAMTVVGRGPLKHEEVRSYVGKRSPEIIQGSRVNLGSIPVKAELEFADVQDFLMRMIKYGLARRQLKERIRQEAKGKGSSLAQLAALLREGPGSPKCLEADRWQEEVKPVTRPFLERIWQAWQKRSGASLGEPRFAEYVRNVQLTRMSIDSVSFVLARMRYDLYVGVWLGSESKAGDLNDKLVWGISLWGSRDFVESLGDTLVKLEVIPENRGRIDTSAAFKGGVTLTVLDARSPDELEGAVEVELVERIVSDLDAWIKRLSPKLDQIIQVMRTVPVPEGNSLGSLDKYVRGRGFQFPSSLLATYYLSLQTKPFVILTGISGTGKTKLAQLFAEWMSPVVETEVTVSESPEPTDTSFYIEIKPYMLKYSRAVVPVGVWQYFDVPELGQSTQVRLAYPGGEEVCKLGLQPHPQNPNGYLQLLFKGGLRRWMRDNLAVGDLLMIETIGEEGEAYRLEKYRPQTRTVVERERNYAFVPVRPDWTDSRGLLGFQNLITGTYSATDFLRLLLRAAINLQSARPRPYFVILDEMNLAKVEYYFADFLSVMESRWLGEGGNIEQERLILHNQPRCVLAAGNEEVVDASYYHEERFTCLVKCEECPFATFVDEGYHHDGEFDYEEARATGFTPQHFVPPRLTVPLNVYFAGTVNVDETTYMFSPKVLDRANTIEFGDVHLDTYFGVAHTDGATASTADEQTIEIFANNRQFTLLPKQVPELRSDPELAPYRDQLVRLNQLLKPFEMHFGYRVADEVLLYLWNAQELNDPAFSLDVAFDHQIYQKVLPKFHGSQAKLREPLEALRAFCEEHGYALSGAKIQRMLGMLMKEGFASFA
jgi:5-methylcytosine-specific restriction endonuclease McrBC GTP-binding regulatory subunit McrB